MATTYPNEAWPTDVTTEALDGTTHQGTGLPYVAKGTGPTSVPTYEVQYNRRLARQNGILESWRRGMVVSEGGLTIGVYPMDYMLGGARKTFDGATAQAVPDDVQRVVYIDAANTLQIQSVWPSDSTSFVPLAIVTSANGNVTIQDVRAWAAFRVPQIETGAGTFGAVVIPDATGASPQTVAVQVQDVKGTNLAETVYLVVSVHDAVDGGGGFATNATIAVGAAGTLIESLTAGKELFCKTNASGQLDITVTDASAETIYLVSRPFRRAKHLDCSDPGTVTIT